MRYCRWYCGTALFGVSMDWQRGRQGRLPSRQGAHWLFVPPGVHPGHPSASHLTHHPTPPLPLQTFEVLKEYKSAAPINSAALSPIFDHVLIGGGQVGSSGGWGPQGLLAVGLSAGGWRAVEQDCVDLPGARLA